MRSYTTTTPHLPTELLSEILENVDEDTDTLPNVSLTCRRFRSLAQALIFRSFHLIDNCGGGNIDASSSHSARLDFYSSDAIAPFVREFVLSGDMLMEPEYLIAKVFDELPRFINIRSLRCYGVNFTQFALRQVSTLSSLENFAVVDCSTPPQADTLPMLRPRTFECSGYPSLDEVDTYHHWLALLDPHRLQVLNIPFTKTSSSFFLDSPSFPSLYSVDLDVDLEVLSMLPRLLSKTPALRSLKLRPSYLDLARHIHIVKGLVSPTTCPVPNLEEYRGPHELLPIILGRAMGSPSAHLRRLLLESVGDAGEPLDDFMNSLKSCHPLQLRALTHLHISLLESMDLKSLAMLQDVFPVLQEFYLHASEKYGRSGLSCEFFCRFFLSI
jgi:hypothetical protein